MDADHTPDDDLRDPPTPVDLLLPGAWRNPRPDLRAARRPGDGTPLAPPPPVVRPPSGPSTLPLPLGDLADPVAAVPPGPPAPPAPLPPLPEWSAPPPARPVGGRAVLGVAAGLVVVGGASLWLGLLPAGGGSSPAPAAPAASAEASVVPASEPSTAAPTTATPSKRAATRSSSPTKPAPRTSTSSRRSSTSARPRTVLVDPTLYVGLPARKAQRALAELGLRVEVRLVRTGVQRRPAGTVVAVRPFGRVPAGSTVTLLVAR